MQKWDGCDYPHQLKENDIPLGARLLGVVDTFDEFKATERQ